MFTKDDEQYLLRALNRNSVILFLGAGFSRNANNGLGATIPLSRDLASSLWNWLGYDGAYDDTPLGEMYEATLGSGRPFRDIETFLDTHLLCDVVPSEYDALASVFWRRIYTTNVDNLLEIVWQRASTTELEPLLFPGDDVRERDQLLNRIQAIYLHGKLPCRPDEVTFTPRQYARRTVAHDPLYDHFVRDYATCPTIFLGTELNEPLFFQYIEARQSRTGVPMEHRPKSFLIAPRISPPKRRNLSTFNITALQASASDFLAWLASQAAHIASKDDVLRLTVPTYARIAAAAGGPSPRKAALEEFALAFAEVPLSIEGTPRRSTFLLGTTPRWDDILQDLDAPRTITSRLIEEVLQTYESDPRLHLVAILGHAGCGKSTILRRLGLSLGRRGVSVYLTNSEEMPRAATIARALDVFKTRMVLLFDNAEGVIGFLPQLTDRLSRIDRPPIVIVAARTNEFNRKVGRLSDDITLLERDVPNLDKQEISDLLDRLEANNLLGQLRGMSNSERVRQFTVRAGKQLLVAMREATTGRGFDEILVDEFNELGTEEAKILYLCAALATDAGWRIRRDELLGCARVKPGEALHLINRILKGIVMATGIGGDLLVLRHRKIAEFMVDEAAPRSLLATAYIRILTVLSGEMGKTDRWSRTFLLYRAVVNHLTIYRRFSQDIEQARAIYDSLVNRFSSDSQFWLQFGSLELEAGDLELAENYLEQSHSLDPHNKLTVCARGHLLLRKAIEATGKAQAIKFRDRGSEMLLEFIADPQSWDIHPYHIYVSQRFGWVRRWASSIDEKKEEFEHLRGLLEEGVTNFPRSYALRKLAEDVEREYLSLAVENAGK